MQYLMESKPSEKNNNWLRIMQNPIIEETSWSKFQTRLLSKT